VCVGGTTSSSSSSSGRVDPAWPSSSAVTSSPRPPACRCLPDLSGQLRAPCPRQRHGRPLGSIRERTAYYSSLCWLRSVSAAAAGAAIPLPSSIVLVRPSIGIVTTQALSLAWETCTFAAHQLQPPCSLAFYVLSRPSALPSREVMPRRYCCGELP